MKKIKTFFVGLILTPLMLATLACLPQAVASLKTQLDALALIFLGISVYILFEVMFNKPMRTYVFGHELTHALASIAMGGKVHDFKVSAKGGSVSLSKTNFFVALAPYCIPIYTFFVLLIYWALKKFYPFEGLETGFFVLLGASLAFHASLTFYAVGQDQPDIKKTGVFFSLIFIVLINCWILVLLSKVLFWGSISLRGFVLATVRTQADIWVWLWMTSHDAFDRMKTR